MTEQSEKIIPPYDQLGEQLRDLPSTKGKTPTTSEERMALANHACWLEATLLKRYQPTADPSLSYRLFAQEAGTFDLVRGAVLADGLQLVTASSHFVLCITVDVRDFDQGQKTPLELAQNAVEQLFALPGSAPVLLELGVSGQEHFGIRDFKAEGKTNPPDWPHWADVLAWFCDGSNLSFITTKAPGGPTQQNILPTADQNSRWFTASK